MKRKQPKSQIRTLRGWLIYDPRLRANFGMYATKTAAIRDKGPKEIVVEMKGTYAVPR